MTNEQLAIVKARAIIIKMEEAVKILEEVDKDSIKMWDWWDKTILHFNPKEFGQYDMLYEKSKTLDKKLKELTE